MKKILIGSSFTNLKLMPESRAIIVNNDILNTLNVNDFILGQGIYNKNTSQEQLFGALIPEDKIFVHKRLQQNVVVTKSRQEGKKYYCDGIIYNDNELICDHVTGWHISGMLQKELVRQLVLSTIMNWLEANGTCCFTLEHNTSFKKMVLPLSIQLELEVSDVKSKEFVTTYFFVIKIIQFGQEKSIHKMKVQTMPSEYKIAFERQMVKRLLKV